MYSVTMLEAGLISKCQPGCALKAQKALGKNPSLPLLAFWWLFSIFSTPHCVCMSSISASPYTWLCMCPCEQISFA